MNALETVLEKSVAKATDVEYAIQILCDKGFVGSADLAAQEYARLIAENASLKLALDFYANPNNWEWKQGYCPVEDDAGRKARTILGFRE